MKWPVEKDIRLFTLDTLRVRPAEFKEPSSTSEPPVLYETLREQANAVPRPLELDAASAA